MWPMLSSGDRVRVWVRGRQRLRAVVVVAIGQHGELELALPPASPRGRWRPWHVERDRVRGVFDFLPWYDITHPAFAAKGDAATSIQRAIDLAAVR